MRKQLLRLAAETEAAAKEIVADAAETEIEAATEDGSADGIEEIETAGREIGTIEIEVSEPNGLAKPSLRQSRLKHQRQKAQPRLRFPTNSRSATGAKTTITSTPDSGREGKCLVN